MRNHEVTISAYVDRLVAEMRGSSDSLIGRLAQRARLSNRIKLSFGNLQRDPEAGWITMLDQDQVGGWGAHPGRLLLFTGDGRFVAELDRPSTWGDHVVYGGHVHAIEEDEEAYRSVAKSAINLPNDLSVSLGSEHSNDDLCENGRGRAVIGGTRAHRIRTGANLRSSWQATV